MSHVVELKVKGLEGETRVTDLDALKLAFARIGGVWHEGRTSPRYYGRDAGDTEWPPWLTEAGMRQFDHVVSMPGCPYEIGIKYREGAYSVVYDHYDRQTERKLGGKEMTILNDAYVQSKTQLDTAKKLIRVAQNQGYGAAMKVLPNHTCEVTINYG